MRLSYQGVNLLLTRARFIVFGAFVNVLLSVFDEPVKQTGEFASHGRDGLGRT
jgi:hypothetical protein